MPSTTINVENFRELATVIVGNSGQELVADRQDIELEDSDFKNPSEISLGLGIGKANKWYAGLEYVNSQKSLSLIHI